jgi:hypothetical protein
MAATCARSIAIQRQNTPQAHSNSPRDTLDKSRFIFRLSALTAQKADLHMEGSSPKWSFSRPNCCPK